MSFQEFIHMGGYGFYIWTSYAAATVIFIGLYVSVKMQNKKLVKQLARRYRQQDKQNQQ